MIGVFRICKKSALANAIILNLTSVQLCELINQKPNPNSSAKSTGLVQGDMRSISSSVVSIGGVPRGIEFSPSSWAKTSARLI
jgi:hypothetical protein